jgi:hypothetical protein
MPPHNSDQSDESRPTMDVGTALALLELDLRLGLALRDSRELRLSLLADDAELLVSLPQDAGWMHLTPDGLSLSVDRPTTLAGVATRAHHDVLDEITKAASPSIRQAFQRPTDYSRQLVMSMFEDNRVSFSQLAEWAPLIEASAHRVAAQFTIILDRMRAEVHDACVLDQPKADDLAVNYRRLVGALARWTLLYSDGGSTWLPDMANFVWERWTPSLALVRERDRWGALIGARAASRFGPAVIHRYLEVLSRAQQPLIALDALVGLAAIGVQHPDQRDALVIALDRELARLADRETFRPDIIAIGYAQARRVLTRNIPLLTGVANRREDALIFDPSGNMAVFTFLPTALASPARQLIPAAHQRKSISTRTARQMFARAWGDGPVDLRNLPPSAFGKT